MSINSALLAGASGLLANSSALASISDNIANVNTVGYKRANAVFTPQYESRGGAARYTAGGVGAYARLSISESGLLTAGSSPTDLAISGNGFFVVRDQSDATAADAVSFTRAGRFNADASGFLRNDAGKYLSGWPVAADGSVTSNPSDLNALETINLSSIGGAAQATSSVGINANLLASQTISAQEATYDPTASATNMASGTVTPDFQRSIPIYDSQGGVRTITVSLLKQDPTGAAPRAANQWWAEIHVTPAADVDIGAGLVDGQVANGVLAFDAEGRIDTTNTTLPASLSFGASSGAAPGAAGYKWATDAGIAAQNLALDFGSPAAPGGFTQFDSPSTLLSTNVDGSAFGNFAGVDIDDGGNVFAKFTNGIVRRIYQVPIATFVNPDGLQAESGGSYTVTPDSGAFTLGSAGLGNAGNIAASTLENSNVDLATEFTGLITTQRAYSASSKIITTADEMLDEAIRMKR
jgi:flagellar hook protein FlgE